MGLVQLTVVTSQGEADVICSRLRADGIDAHERAATLSVEHGGGYGSWREILVRADQFERARDILGARLAP